MNNALITTTRGTQGKHRQKHLFVKCDGMKEPTTRIIQ